MGLFLSKMAAEKLLLKYIFKNRISNGGNYIGLIRLIDDTTLKTFRNNTCPYCEKQFKSTKALNQHLTHGNTKCKRNFNLYISSIIEEYFIKYRSL